PTLNNVDRERTPVRAEWYDPGFDVRAPNESPVANRRGLAILDDQGILHSEFRSEGCVGHQMSQGAMNRQEATRPQESNQVTLLFTVRVAARMDASVPGRDDLGTLAQQSVNHAGHRPLIARNNPGREDHRVARQ